MIDKHWLFLRAHYWAGLKWNHRRRAYKLKSYREAFAVELRQLYATARNRVEVKSLFSDMNGEERIAYAIEFDTICQ